ncbi:ATPase_AAA_core domain-containing protein [Caenorhabditis elegans]|uniref:ATPase_AAA_core domain-containing protein n=1 Tax=Caenorhabditis elegans TaxID=6239 RepID=Q19963_CAEEL|nr:ATPase_AAA_core domain-containing protein [Caenorhabditis elegans]CAA98454.2 ATPase_AAA_core domain-containing protein [Caenorhabditis elegans]|eukprot:NP_505771.2 Uncharacterized protein CELE_F32D8.2 [Caenorhabditis elegans]
MSFNLRKHQSILPSSMILMFLCFFLLIFSVIMSHFSIEIKEFDKDGGIKYKPEFVYSLVETRELLTNVCKLPYIFFPNEDEDVFGLTPDKSKQHIVRGECKINELNEKVDLSSDGYLTLRSKNTNDLPSDIRCTFYKNSGPNEHPIKVEKNVPVKVPFYNFAFACERNGIVEFLKPFVNFASIPKKSNGGSIAIIFLPAINHKLFMKKMPLSKHFMQDNQFRFAQFMSKNEPNSMQDLLLQLGISNKINMFRKAKQNNFTTFFSGPQQIRYMIDVDYDTLDHQNFITQFLIDGNLCLKNGKKLVNDQLEKIGAFLTSTADSKVFSAMFIDEYDEYRRQSIDQDLKKMLDLLKESNIFENTTLIITSYDLSTKDIENENDKYPMFAFRPSNQFIENNNQKLYFMNMNFNRLLSSTNFNQMLVELINPKEKSSKSVFIAQPTSRNCTSEGISENICLCMNMSTSSGYPEKGEKNFLQTLRTRFTQEVKTHKCVRSFELEDYKIFYEYSIGTSKEVRGVELTGFVNIISSRGKKTLLLKKMFTFKPEFASFNSFDTARVVVGYEVNIGIAR